MSFQTKGAEAAVCAMVVGRDHDVVLALPGRVIKMIKLCFHHGLLEGSWRFPKDFKTSFPQL